MIEPSEEQWASSDGDVVRSNLRHVPRLRPELLTRLLAMAGAALFFVAAWVPWLVGVYSPDGSVGQAQLTAVYVDGGHNVMPGVANRLLGAPAAGIARLFTLLFVIGVPVLWAWLTGLGLLLAPLLWTRTGARAGRWARRAYGIWLAVTSLLAAVLLAALTQWQATISASIPLVWRPGAGLPLMALALVIGWSAWLRLRRERPAAPAIVADTAVEGGSRARLASLAAALATLGVAIWAVGFFAVPWAADNCSSLPFSLNHFVEGRCAALDSGDALSTLLGRHLSAAMWNVSVALYPLYGTLLTGGLLAVIAIWRGRLSFAARAWVACWLLGATGCAMLASRGVSVIITQAPLLSSDSAGVWRRASGIPITLVGLLLAWAGLLALERAVHHASTARTHAG